MNARTRELMNLLNQMRAETVFISLHLDHYPEENNKEGLIKWRSMMIEYYKELENKYKILKNSESLMCLKEYSGAMVDNANKSLFVTRAVLDRTKEFLSNFNITNEENIPEEDLDVVRYKLRFKYRDPESGSVKKLNRYIYIDNSMSTGFIIHQIIQTIKIALDSFGESLYDNIIVDDNTRPTSAPPKTGNYICTLIMQMYRKKYNKKIKVNLTFINDPNKIIKLSICNKPDNEMKLGMKYY